MCGILAVFSRSTPQQLKKIILGGKLLETRGPDRCVSRIKNDGIYIFHRLSMNDVTTCGDQPMVRNGVTMMCNGEIYNSKELAKEYDITCSSHSDCEVILHLYKKIGFVETVKRLDGVFAIVLTDGDKAYLARDRIGVRPLHFGLTEEKYLAVASTPECLEGWCRAVTPFPPGMSALHDKSSDKMITWLHRDLIDKPEKSIVNPQPKMLYDALYTAVKKRLLTDRPIGCLLSGGLDSSCVVALLCEMLGAENVRTYSIGMECSTDLKYARMVAEHFGTNHKEIIFTPEEGFAVIPDIVRVLGSYDITTIRASVGMYLIAKYISEKTDDRTIFSGEGSDELLCGYLYFHNTPSPEDAENESIKLLRNLHIYDVLRADRTISSNGLELRVPFLDRRVVDTGLALQAKDKIPANGYEKYLLRKAFEDKLPKEVVWRRKEGFSDGVSGTKKAWYEHIQEKVEDLIPDSLFNSIRYPSKEAMYYRLLFEKYFPTYNINIPYWMPNWSDATDPSGRMIEAYDEDESPSVSDVETD